MGTTGARRGRPGRGRMTPVRAIFFEEDDAQAVVARLRADGFEARAERERLAGEDDDEGHPWAVVTDAPAFMLEVLVDTHDGWLDEDDGPAGEQLRRWTSPPPRAASRRPDRVPPRRPAARGGARARRVLGRRGHPDPRRPPRTRRASRPTSATTAESRAGAPALRPHPPLHDGPPQPLGRRQQAPTPAPGDVHPRARRRRGLPRPPARRTTAHPAPRGRPPRRGWTCA